MPSKVPRPGRKGPVLFLRTPFDEAMPQISPDNRYLAYMSNISGRWEVYVRPFPKGEREWQISLKGGGYPRWSSRGNELFYVDKDALMSAKVVTRPTFRIEATQKLFEWKQLGLYLMRRYDVTADGAGHHSGSRDNQRQTGSQYLGTLGQGLRFKVGEKFKIPTAQEESACIVDNARFLDT